MLKNYTRQLFAQLSRHLPRRLVQRDPRRTPAIWRVAPFLNRLVSIA